MLMIKVITMVADIGSTLDPDFNLLERIKPYIGNLLRSTYFSRESLENTRNALSREILRFPESVRRFLENVSSGKSRMEVTVPEITETNQSVRGMGWRLFLGLIGMGLILGLSIILSTTSIVAQESLSLIAMIGGVALLVIILVGIRSGS